MASFYTGSSTLVLANYSKGPLFRRSTVLKLRVRVRIRVSGVRFKDSVTVRFRVCRSRVSRVRFRVMVSGPLE